MSKNILIGGSVFLVLCFFGFGSFQNIDTKNAPYKNEIEKSNYSKSSNQKTLEEISQLFENKMNSNEEYIFTYSSTFYDIEKNGIIVQTKKELTYHTFDLNKKTVTQKSKRDGEWIELTYPFKDVYQEKGMLSTTYVLRVNTLGVKEIWWTPEVPNLGYDYDDGTRIACYEVKRE